MRRASAQGRGSHPAPHPGPPLAGRHRPRIGAPKLSAKKSGPDVGFLTEPATLGSGKEEEGRDGSV